MTKATLSVVMCPITMNLVVDPVVAADGHTRAAARAAYVLGARRGPPRRYEREAIERWLRDKGRSPMTNQHTGATGVELRGGREVFCVVAGARHLAHAHAPQRARGHFVVRC